MTIGNTLKRRSSSSWALRENLWGYIFISPFLLGLVFWLLGPILYSMWISIHEWDLLSPPIFTGLGNFRHLLEDELFWQSLKVTAIFTLVRVPGGLVLGFAIALLMNAKLRGISIFRTIYYLPSIVPAVANAMLWVWIFNTEFGLLNMGLRGLGFPKVLWLQDPKTALPALLIMSFWSVGGTMVIYLAGLQGIPEVYYEAAEIDGAGAWVKLRRVTIPLMSPVILFNLVMGVINTFQVFSAGYIMTNGGPKNSTLFYVLYLFRNAFQYMKMGYAAALAWVLFLIILALSLLIFRYVGGQVYYEEPGR
jgi:multiple sugar transport system permease protein